MNWYVKYEGTEEISGPMTKKEALDKADRADGMVFNERIFDPEFVTTPEVDEVLGSLRSIATWASQEVDRDLNELRDELSVVCRKAIDTIILLSGEAQDTEE